MNIPKHLIIDLLPLYLAGEVSDETRDLIEGYLKSDPQLATLAEQAKDAKPLQEIPAPLNKESEMEALRKVKKMLVQHNVFLVIAVIVTFLFGMSILFLQDENPLAPFVLFGLAAFFWTGFYLVNRKIGD